MEKMNDRKKKAKIDLWWLTGGWFLQLRGVNATESPPGKPLPGKPMSGTQTVAYVREEGSRRARKLIIVGAVIYGIIGYVIGSGTGNWDYAAMLVPSWLVWCCICLYGENKKASRNGLLLRARSGVDSESMVAKAVRRIDRPLEVFENLKIPNARSRTGTTEIDLVVVGKKAIYLVEVKNAGPNRVVVGNKKGWRICGRDGDTKEMRDPVKQVEIQGKVVREYLSSVKGLRSDQIKPIVMITAPRTRITAADFHIPVFQTMVSQLAKHIEEMEGRSITSLPSGILEALRKLK